MTRPLRSHSTQDKEGAALSTPCNVLIHRGSGHNAPRLGCPLYPSKQTSEQASTNRVDFGLPRRRPLFPR